MPDLKTQTARVYGAGRRILTITLTIVAAVLVGVWLSPIAAKHYYATRLDTDNATQRARALEAVLPYARSDESIRRRLLDVLATLAASDDDVATLQAKVAAAWLFQHVPDFTNLVETRLETSDDQTFPRLARLTIRAGRWDAPARPLQQRIRWLTHRFHNTNGQDRADVVAAMSELGPTAATQLRDPLTQAVSDQPAEVRAAAIQSVAIILGTSGADLLARAITDDHPDNRRLAVLLLAAIGPTDHIAPALRIVLHDKDERVRLAAAWAASRLERSPKVTDACLSHVNDLLTRDHKQPVRAMAALAVRDHSLLIDQIRTSQNVPTRARCLRSLRPPLTGDDLQTLAEIINHEPKYWVVTAALFAASRPNDQPACGTLRDPILSRLQRALQAEDDDLAAACLDALSAVGDKTTVTLLADVATKLTKRPWVALAASRALTRIDPEQGPPLLVRLLESPAPGVQGLTAFELARLPASALPRAELDAAARSPNESLRAGAILALALNSYLAQQKDEQRLAWLTERTSPESRLFEARLPLRGHYLCGQLLLGDATALPRIESLLAAGALPPATACLAMLVTRSRTALDDALIDESRMPPACDPRDLLVDQRFGEIISAVLPDAPPVDCQMDPDLQRWQIDRLRDWWRIYRLNTH
ncbi:MAG: HEAT repeat domain-containing protein [Phycisphaerae bacterium]|nr:HEAT repeat domain-containing protein [Phycisphaerae bacterium]